ncbi:MAG: hypothetical protein AB7G38_18240 [Dehalococcoidia bacterium]
MPTTTLRPVGDGSVIQWTPSTGGDNYAMVDEASADDLTTYVSLTDAAAKTDAYTHGAGVPSNATSISVEVFGRAATLDAAAAANFYPALRIGGVNYLGDSETIIASTAWLNFSHVFATDPSTGVAWTPSGINNAELACYCQSVSKGGGGAILRLTQLYAVVTYTQPVTVSPAGSLPAMAGALAVKFIKAIAGILPGMSGSVANDAPTHVGGSLPAQSGAIFASSATARSVRGRLPAMSGALGVNASIAVRGNLPAQQGQPHLSSSLALAGNLPAMQGRIDDFAITTTDKSHSLSIALFPRMRVRRLGGRTEVRKL